MTFPVNEMASSDLDAAREKTRKDLDWDVVLAMEQIVSLADDVGGCHQYLDTGPNAEDRAEVVAHLHEHLDGIDHAIATVRRLVPRQVHHGDHLMSSHSHIPRLPVRVCSGILEHLHRDTAYVVLDCTPKTLVCGMRWACYHPTGEADYPTQSGFRLVYLAAMVLVSLDTTSPLPEGRPHVAILTRDAQVAMKEALVVVPGAIDLPWFPALAGGLIAPDLFAIAGLLASEPAS